jgi:hypothetical protein
MALLKAIRFLPVIAPPTTPARKYRDAIKAFQLMLICELCSVNKKVLFVELSHASWCQHPMQPPPLDRAWIHATLSLRRLSEK